jgi:hypothetical protein
MKKVLYATIVTTILILSMPIGYEIIKLADDLGGVWLAVPVTAFMFWALVFGLVDQMERLTGEK